MVLTQLDSCHLEWGFEATIPNLSYNLNLSGDGSVIQIYRRTHKSEEVFSLLPVDFASGLAGEFAEFDHIQSASYEEVVVVMKSNAEIRIRDLDGAHIEFEFGGANYNEPVSIKLSHFIKAGAY